MNLEFNVILSEGLQYFIFRIIIFNFKAFLHFAFKCIYIKSNLPFI